MRARRTLWTPDAAAHASGEIAGASAAEGVARVYPRMPVAAGDRVSFEVDFAQVHFFDGETGHAIEAADPSGAGRVGSG